MNMLANFLLATNLTDLPEIGPNGGIPPTSSGELGMTFVKMLLTFAALILLLFGTYWFLRRIVQSRLHRSGADASIHVLEKKMISAKTMLYLVEVENRKVLLAESQVEIKKIESFPIEVPEPE